MTLECLRDSSKIGECSIRRYDETSLFIYWQSWRLLVWNLSDCNYYFYSSHLFGLFDTDVRTFRSHQLTGVRVEEEINRKSVRHKLYHRIHILLLLRFIHWSLTTHAYFLSDDCFWNQVTERYRIALTLSTNETFPLTPWWTDNYPREYFKVLGLTDALDALNRCIKSMP